MNKYHAGLTFGLVASAVHSMQRFKDQVFIKKALNHNEIVMISVIATLIVQNGIICCPGLFCFLFLYQEDRYLLKFIRGPDEQNGSLRGKKEKSPGSLTVQFNEICYSGPFYTHLITRSNRFCETPSPFEDPPTTHVI